MESEPTENGPDDPKFCLEEFCLHLFSSYNLKTERHSGLFSLFDHVIRGDHAEVKRAKPNPDIFLMACEKFRQAYPFFIIRKLLVL